MKRPNFIPLFAVAWAASVACADATDATSTPPPGCDQDWTEVTFATSDGVDLVADWRPATSPNRPLVVLFHMHPGGNDRSGYPKRVRNAIHDLDMGVLNVDRRGGGESGGVVDDAFTGVGGRLDMEASVSFGTDAARDCPVDASRLMVVGASNGTTSALDYTVGHDASLPTPSALIWMSPGTYTESQNAIADHRKTLDVIDIQWLFPTNEPYSKDFQNGAPAGWSFVERGTAHGTRMFDEAELEDQTLADMIAFFQAHLP